MNINQLYATPGHYKLTTPEMQARGQYVNVEVDNEGVCHQLNRKGERDGPLSKEGWNEQVIVLEMVCN